MEELTQVKLKEALHYSPLTGLFTWKINRRGSAKKGGVAGSFHQSTGYMQIGVYSIRYGVHRLAWFYMTGEWPDQIDHINHIKTDNRWCNIRNTTVSGNQKNQNVRVNSKSGVIGVILDKRTSKWQDQIKNQRKHIYLGLYADKFEAICARKSAEAKYGFHENHGIQPAQA